MKNNPFKKLNQFEKCLWCVSVSSILLSYFIFKGNDIMTLTASLIGVTALIFVAKGFVIGQVLTVIFSVFYGIISYYFAYYGEMITYLGMTTPIAILAIISWLRHPYEDTDEVSVQHITKQQLLTMMILTVGVTILFYFILKFLGNSNLIFSTVSVTTSFIASYLTFLRSPYYALGYAANDVILIILWILATVEDHSYFPMIICFILFLVNDIYGFINWLSMEKRQNKTEYYINKI